MGPKRKRALIVWIRPKVKSFEIHKRLVFEAWEKVRANNGAPGVDAVSIAEFGNDVRNNVYKLWAHLSVTNHADRDV